MRPVLAAGVACVLFTWTAAARAEHDCTECHDQGHGHHHHHHPGLLDRAKARARYTVHRGREKWQEARDRFVSDYHEAHYWPDPYRCQARQSALVPFDIQMNNAWANMTNVNAFFFDPDSHKLTSAGRVHVQWILQQAPVSRRMLTVQEGELPSITEARLASLRDVVAEIAGEDNQIAIAVSNRVPFLGAGIDVDVSSRLYYSSFPLPRLPGTTTAPSSAAAPAGLPGVQ